MTELTHELIYLDLYNSTYNDLIKYGLDEDLASIKANKYAIKNANYYLTSDDNEALVYRNMLLNKTNEPQYLSEEEIKKNLLELADKDLL